jgi:divalent metal cation (Fe/Co/Zn/Cd) transporter
LLPFAIAAGRHFLCALDSHHSPLLKAYYLDYRASFVSETFVYVTLVFGLAMVNWGEMRFAVMIDIVVAAFIALYLLYNGCRLSAAA